MKVLSFFMFLLSSSAFSVELYDEISCSGTRENSIEVNFTKDRVGTYSVQYYNGARNIEILNEEVELHTSYLDENLIVLSFYQNGLYIAELLFQERSGISFPASYVLDLESRKVPLFCSIKQ